MRRPIHYIAAGLIAAALPISAAGQTIPASAAGPVSFADIDRAVRAQSYKRVTSIIVMRDGKLLHEAYFKGDANTLRNTRSMTKTVTALLIGAAIDRGLIRSVREPVVKWFRDVRPRQNPDPRTDRITIEDFLTMSSLLECNDENSFSRGNEERMYLVEDWLGFTLGLPIRGTAPWETPPAEMLNGRAWSYCTAGVSMLGALLERAARKPLPQFADDVLHRPLGIGTVQWQFAPQGFAQAGGGTGYRTRDLAALAELIREGGEKNGASIISRPYIDAMTRPQAHINDERGDYGYLTWLPPVSSKGRTYRAFAMLGSGGNRTLIIPELKLVAVVTAENFGNRDAHALSQRLIEDQLIPAVLGTR